MSKVAKEKKVILFVVEGDTEETALAGAMESAFSNDRIFFDIVRGDLTTQKDAGKNPRERVRNRVLAHIERNNGYGWNDLERIVQIGDTDGAFVPDSSVLSSDGTAVDYTESSILAPDPAGICLRNKQKALAMRQLARISSLTYRKKSVPYGLYFFSRNMEHALHGEAGILTRDKKIELANKFRRMYGNDPEGFAKLLKSEDVLVAGDYAQTWAYLEKGSHSLERGSNLGLLV